METQNSGHETRKLMHVIGVSCETSNRRNTMAAHLKFELLKGSSGVTRMVAGWWIVAMMVDNKQTTSSPNYAKRMPCLPVSIIAWVDLFLMNVGTI